MDQNKLNEIYQGFEHFFPEEGSPNNEPFLKWKSRTDFVEEIKELTKIDIASGSRKLIKDSQQILETIAVSTEKAKANRPTLEQIEISEKEMAIKEGKRQEAIKESKAAVERAIQRRQELHDKLVAENKKISVKVERVVSPPTPEEIKADETVAELKAKYEIENHQREMVEDVAKVIEEKITPVFEAELSHEEIKARSRDAATKFVEAINNPKVVAKYTEDAEHTAIFKAAALDTKVIPEESRIAAGNIAAIRSISVESTRAIIKASFGEGFGKFFGFSTDVFNVSFYENPVSGNTHELDLVQLDSTYANILDQQSSFLNDVGGMAQGEARSFLFDKIGSSIESRIMSLPEDSALRGLYQNGGIRNLLSIASGQPISITVDSSFLTGFAAKVPGGMGVINGIGNVLGFNVVSGGAAGVAGGAAATVGAEAAGAAVGITTVETVSVAAAPATGGLSLIVTAVAALVGPKVVGFVTDNIQKYGKFFIGAVGALFGLALMGGSILGAVLGFAIGYGGAVLISGGLPALSASAASLGSGIAGFFGALGGATIGAIGIPILATLIGFPVVVALILFIINSSAYVVPPEMSLLSSANPYIDVQKTADPEGTIASPTTITYTVTVTAKKDVLTFISFQNKCQGIKKSGSTLDCKNLEKMPTPSEIPPSISPGTPFSFTFTSAYDSRYQDTLVSDTVTVFAVSESGGEVSETGAASVCFGNCPLDCFKTADNGESWPSSYKANLDTAAAVISGKYPNFAAKACAAGTVNLCYTTSNPSPIGTSGMCNGTIYARHIHAKGCDINFNQCGIKNQSDALFILTHEATHHIQTITPNYERLFEQGVPQGSWPICTYSATNGDPYESHAESSALFVGKPSWNNCVTSFASQYPKNYQFVKNVMFSQ